LDPAAEGLPAQRRLFGALQCPAGDRDDLIEIAFQRRFYWLLLLRFQK